MVDKLDKKAEDKPKKEVVHPIKICIISLKTNRDDILFFIDELNEIKKKHKKNIEIILFGYDLSQDSGYESILGVNHKYVKSVSIIHYFKQLKSLQIDLLFIPLINNVYNQTSENYNKYLEAGIFGVPIICPDMFPYNKIVIDKRNGFLFKEKNDFLEAIASLLKDRNIIKEVGKNAREDILKNFIYNEENIKLISNSYQ